MITKDLPPIFAPKQLLTSGAAQLALAWRTLRTPQWSSNSARRTSLTTRRYSVAYKGLKLMARKWPELIFFMSMAVSWDYLGARPFNSGLIESDPIGSLIVQVLWSLNQF